MWLKMRSFAHLCMNVRRLHQDLKVPASWKRVLARKRERISAQEELKMWRENGRIDPNHNLTQDQTSFVESLENRIPRLMYLRRIQTGIGPEDAEIVKIDKSITSRDMLDPMIIQDAASGDEVLAGNLNFLHVVFDRLSAENGVLPHEIDKMQMRRLLNIESAPAVLRNVKILATKCVKQIIQDSTPVKIPDPKDDPLLQSMRTSFIYLMNIREQRRHIEDWSIVREHYPDWGKTIVFDLRFLSSMNYRQVDAVLREIGHGVSYIKQSPHPLSAFAVYFTGYKYGSHTQNDELLQRHFPQLEENHSSIVITDQAPYECFPAENIVYLTPDSPNELENIDGSEVFVIGGIELCPREQVPLTLDRAKARGIRHAKFPLKKNLEMTHFRDELSIDHAVAMLTDFVNTQDWKYAVRWMPPRRLKQGLRMFQSELLVRNDSSEKSKRKENQMRKVVQIHEKLCPMKSPKFKRMRPTEYHEKFKELEEK